ncbi:hypothetical protein PILCRDRAFT_828238 [Piloderma croceum F 1598]|uniref:Uncharacterized protein n=1 Tax=Piloderma croceum (strain F 1598) TaxID=765440 RepID=A0A0C3EP85_PILCF|nr:hypothetical protein PILCRDRAFT_828238 [Piloderma croceum F 1598]
MVDLSARQGKLPFLKFYANGGPIMASCVFALPDAFAEPIHSYHSSLAPLEYRGKDWAFCSSMKSSS